MNQPIENRPTFNICNSNLAHTVSNALKIYQHSSSSCKGTLGLLRFMGSNNDFAVLMAWLVWGFRSPRLRNIGVFYWQGSSPLQQFCTTVQTVNSSIHAISFTSRPRHTSYGEDGYYTGFIFGLQRNSYVTWEGVCKVIELVQHGIHRYGWRPLMPLSMWRIKWTLSGHEGKWRRKWTQICPACTMESGKIHENGKYEFTDVIVKFEADRLSCVIKGQTH